jgi:hypothetical protein
MTRVVIGLVAAGTLALWTLPADAKGGLSTAKNRYTQIHAQKAADQQKMRDANKDAGVVLGQMEKNKR